MAYDDTGGVPVFPGATLTSVVTQRGQVRYGDTLMGTGTPAGLQQLISWRDLPDAEDGSSAKPQAHGSYPGSVFGGSLTVTAVFLVRGRPEAKALALAAIERATRMDGVERPLIVHDGTGASFRMGAVVARTIPQDVHFYHAPVEVSVQWRCADPRRYDLTEVVESLRLATSTGGLAYPLAYPLDYGTTFGSSTRLANTGSADAPLVVTFTGPLVNPRLAGPDWSLQFATTLAAGETLVVDTAAGTVKLNGDADRLYTITSTSDPLEACTIPAAASASVSLTATSGTGTATVTYRAAHL